jgi:multidrug resistance efflux pump
VSNHIEMSTPRLHLLLIALFALIIAPGAVFAQTSNKSKTAPIDQIAQTRSELIEATEKYKASAQEVVQFQEQEIAAATKKLEQLRQLVADGLIARNELPAGEEELAAAKGRLESTQKQIAESDNLIVQIREAEVAEKKLAQALATQAAASRKLLRPTAMRYNGMAGWALANISSV